MILVLLALLGAVQGFLLSLLILFRFRHKKNMPLAFLILAFSLRVGSIPTWNLDCMLNFPWVWPITSTLPFLFGPLLYWSVLSISQEKTVRFSILHFIPYIGTTVFICLFLYVLPEADYAEMVLLIFTGNPPIWTLIINASKVILNCIYVILALCVAFNVHSKRLSTVHRIWIRVLAVFPFVVLCFFSFVALNPLATVRHSEGNSLPFILLSAVMTLLLYAISFLVLWAPTSLEAGGIPLTGKGPALISDEECNELAEKVIKKLSSGLYKNYMISEPLLAKELGVHPNRLSLAINRSQGMPFRKLLNLYRIQHVERCIKNGDLSAKNILTLAYEAGFSSKSTFNRVFKQETGQTPTDYIKHLQQ
ncbi:MAG: helix-turn-helix domain-containing protein [Spirochaetota bacterium]